MCIYIYICILLCMYICNMYIYMYIHTMWVCMYVYIYIYVYVYIYICIYIYTHMYICTYYIIIYICTCWIKWGLCLFYFNGFDSYLYRSICRIVWYCDCSVAITGWSTRRGCFYWLTGNGGKRPATRISHKATQDWSPQRGESAIEVPNLYPLVIQHSYGKGP